MDPDSYLCRLADLFDGVTVTAPTIGAIIAILLAVLLLYASGFVSASEIAFFSLSPVDLSEIEEGKHTSDRRISALLNDSERLLATILISNNFVNVTIEEAYVKQIVDETEAEITADVAVFTMHPGPSIPESGTGMDFRITVDKQRMVIISYSEPNICDSIYNNRLRPLASNYRREGLTWQEANKKAYEELYAEFADYASSYPRETPQG